MKERLYKFAVALIAMPLMIITALSMCLIMLAVPFVALIKPGWITIKTKEK